MSLCLCLAFFHSRSTGRVGERCLQAPLTQSRCSFRSSSYEVNKHSLLFLFVHLFLFFLSTLHSHTVNVCPLFQCTSRKQKVDIHTRTHIHTYTISLSLFLPLSTFVFLSSCISNGLLSLSSSSLFLLSLSLLFFYRVRLNFVLICS